MSTPRDPVEAALEEAIARGDFDDLPGAGKPLDLPDTNDPDWWIKQRLAGDTARQATSPEVKELRSESAALKEVVADLTLENRLLKKSMVADGDNDA